MSEPAAVAGAVAAGASAAAAAATRCARPDCISLREELELLRGDLQEIESENEQLHDKLAQLDAEAQSAKQERQREQTAAQSALTHKQEELERLEHVVHELRTALQHGGQAQTQTRAANAGAGADTDDATTNAQRIAQLEQHNDELRGANAALESAVAELRAASAREVTASAAAQHAVAQLTQASVDKRSELYRALKENELLRGETRELEDALRRTTDAALENEAAATALLAQQHAYRDAVDEQTIEITQLHAKLEAVESEKHALEQQLIAMDERESDVDALLRDARTQHERERAVLRHECDALRQTVQMLKQQQAAAVASTRVINASGTAAVTATNADALASAAADTAEMEQQLDLLQELRVRDRATIAELNQRVLQQQSDLESLTEHLDIDAAVEHAVQRAVTAEQAASVRLRKDHASLKQRVREQSDVVHALERRQAQLERELADAHEWNAKYERGAGLEDVVKFQRQLRKKLEAQQNANATLRQELNAQIEATGKRHAAFERLKAECGKPAAFEYDDLALEHDRKGEIAVLQAVVAQLEQQLQELEAERVRLLHKLREQARVTGHKLYDAHGVTLEQWRLVEEFIERVKLTPELATRLLRGAGTNIDGGSGNDGDDTQVRGSAGATDQSVLNPSHGDHDDVAVKYEAEIAHAHAANQQLVDTVAQLRAELAHAQSQVQAANQHLMVRERENEEHPATAEREDLREIRAQIQRIVQEQATQRSERDLAVAPAAKPVQRDTEVEADLESLSSVSADERDDEDLCVRPKPPTEDPHASPSQTDTRSKQVAAAAVTTAPPATAARDPSPRAHGDPDARVSRSGLQQSDWSSVESIAAAVAKALESKLALLQSSAGSQQGQRQQTIPSPESEVPHSATATASTGVTGTTSTSSHSSAATAPKSPPLVDALAFENEEQLAAQLDVLQELNVCLDELTRCEAQNEHLTQQLAQHEHAFRAVTDQHTLLYQHLFELHAAFARSDAQLQRQVAERTHAHRELQLKCERYEATLHVLAPTSGGSSDGGDGAGGSGGDIESQLRAQVVELTRKTAAYEVNDATYRRKYQQLHADLVAAQTRARTLEYDWLEMERTLKCRITYLESWKSGADALVERMERTLAHSVLKTFAERQELVTVQLLRKHSALSEAYAELHVKWLQVHDVPQQLSRVQHENALLRAEKRASGGDASATATAVAAIVDPVLQARISQLEHELAVQTQRLRVMEEAQAMQHTGMTTASVAGVAGATGVAGAGVLGSPLATAVDATLLGESDLTKENALLCERINEVEQLYESLTRECAKYKDIAALAASQANTLAKRAAQDAARRDDQDAHVRELMAASEDHAVAGQLQRQLQQLKSNYQQFLLKYDACASEQQQHAIRAQQLELELESRSKLLSDERERARDRVAVLETTLAQVAQRDLTVRNAKWDAFRKRLDAIDDALRVEQERRRALEQELEEHQTQLPLLARLQRSGGSAGDTSSSLEVSRLKARVEALETRERVLMTQLESAAKSASFLEQEEMLQAELADTKALNGDLLRQLQAAQTRISALITQHGELESSRRQVAHAKEDLEIELQHAHAQLELLGGGGNNQHDATGGSGPSAGSHSPLMRKKVGMYEQDQAALQQAAQATIASLKQLVAEKNALVSEYERKLTAARLAASQTKAHDRVETAQLHKKLFDDNQRMIAQLQDATAKIRFLERTGGDKRALAAAQERHDDALREWQQSQVALESAQQRIRELERALDVLTNERDIAEARAGEALEEIVLMRENVADQQRVSQQLEHQLAAAKRDVMAKSNKMKLLRDAIIQLKEEFLKAEDRHAVEVAKAQAAAAAAATAAAASTRSRQSKSKANKRGNSDDAEEEDDVEQWREHKARLERQVQLLQEKLALATRTARKRLSGSGAKISDPRGSGTGTGSKREVTGASQDAASAAAAAAANTKILEDEVERLKRVVKDRVVGEARAIEELEKQLRVLEAQNLALREASVSAAPSASGTTSGGGAADASGEPTQNARARTREHWEAEKKLQRRNEALTLRLKDQHAELERAQAEVAQLKQRLRAALEELTQLKRAEQKRVGASAASAGAGVAGPALSASGARAMTATATKEQIEDLERQNRFLQDTLVLKRREWEDAFAEQMDKYERALTRLRRRLSQHGVATPSDEDEDERVVSAAERLRREEQQCLVAQEVHDELVVLGDEVRDKERAIIEKDTQLMALELELESARLEVKRLQRQSAVSTHTQIDQTQMHHHPHIGRRSTSNVSSSSTIKTKPRGTAGAAVAVRSPMQERLELEEVIETMKKVIEKLRSENEKLKSHHASASPGKLERLRRQVKDLRDAREQLEREAEHLRSESAELRKDKLRLQHRLRLASSTLTADIANGGGDRSSRLPAGGSEEVRELQTQLQRKNERLAQLETECAELKRAAARRETLLQELQFQLAHRGSSDDGDGADRDNDDDVVRELEAHVRELEDENAKLQRELAAFDADFFDEIEDLKYQFAQAVREKQRLEQRLRALAQ